MSAVTSSDLLSRVPRGALTVSVVDNETDLWRLAPAWNALLESTPRPAPFLTWEWVSTWWRHFGRGSRLFVLAVHDVEGRLVGVAPLLIRRRTAGRVIEFIGYRGSAVCADHLDFICDPAQQNEVARTLVETILNHRQEWDAITLADLAEDSVVPAAIAAFPHGFSKVTVMPGEICPFAPLGSSYQQYLKGLTSTHGSRTAEKYVRYRRNRLAAMFPDIRLEVCDSVWKVEDILRQLARLHNLARGRKGERGNFALPAYHDFHHELAKRMANRRSLYLAVLRCGESPVAAAYGYEMGGVLYYYQAGFDPAYGKFAVGTVLLSMMLEDAIEHRQIREFDMLRGSESYKFFWATEQRRLNTLRAWNVDLRGGIAHRYFRLRSQVVQWRQSLAAPAAPVRSGACNSGTGSTADGAAGPADSQSDACTITRIGTITR